MQKAIWYQISFPFSQAFNLWSVLPLAQFNSYQTFPHIIFHLLFILIVFWFNVLFCFALFSLCLLNHFFFFSFIFQTSFLLPCCLNFLLPAFLSLLILSFLISTFFSFWMLSFLILILCQILFFYFSFLLFIFPSSTISFSSTFLVILIYFCFSHFLVLTFFP